MAKKKKATPKKTKSKKKAPHIPWTPEEYLELLIGISEKAITKQGSSIDEFFKQQTEKLKKKLAELKGKS